MLTIELIKKGQWDVKDCGEKIGYIISGFDVELGECYKVGIGISLNKIKTDAVKDFEQAENCAYAYSSIRKQALAA